MHEVKFGWISRRTRRLPLNGQSTGHADCLGLRLQAGGRFVRAKHDQSTSPFRLSVETTSIVSLRLLGRTVDFHASATFLLFFFLGHTMSTKILVIPSTDYVDWLSMASRQVKSTCWLPWTLPVACTTSLTLTSTGPSTWLRTRRLIQCNLHFSFFISFFDSSFFFTSIASSYDLKWKHRIFRPQIYLLSTKMYNSNKVILIQNSHKRVILNVQACIYWSKHRG